VAGVYLDTSALGRVVLDEPDADAIGAAMTAFDAIISSRLLRIELHRLGLRAGIPREEIEPWLAGVALVPMDDAILSSAETVSPASVASLDAIHLATALQLADEQHITSIMTFDARLAEGAREHGLPVIAPT
jgi:predicted nucleic acid-binding protein